MKEKLEATRGLKVGVASGPVTILRTLYKSVGMDADTDIEIVIIHGTEQNEALGAGQVDALYAHTPFLEHALVEQDVVLIVNQSAGEVPDVKFDQIHSIATTQSYTKTHPEVLSALYRGVQQAQQLIHHDKQATADALMAAIEGLDPVHLRTIIEIVEPAIPISPKVSVEGVLRILDRFPDHRTPPDLSEVDLTLFRAGDGTGIFGVGEVGATGTGGGSGGGGGGGRGN